MVFHFHRQTSIACEAYRASTYSGHGMISSRKEVKLGGSIDFSVTLIYGVTVSTIVLSVQQASLELHSTSIRESHT